MLIVKACCCSSVGPGKFNPNNPANYTSKWESSQPHTTPDGLADPERAVRLLEETALAMETHFGALDTPWGDYYRIKYNGRDLPANGSPGNVGVFRVAWPGGGDEHNAYVSGGDSWVGVIEFADPVKAKVLLSYGNATQKDSPHNGDQLELFSKKQLRDAWFTMQQVKANTVRVERMGADGFVAEE